jgi:hypothetical protein
VRRKAAHGSSVAESQRELWRSITLVVMPSPGAGCEVSRVGTNSQGVADGVTAVVDAVETGARCGDTGISCAGGSGAA